MVQDLIKSDGFSVIKQWGWVIFKPVHGEQISDPIGILAAGTGGDSPQFSGFFASSNYCMKHPEDEKVTFGGFSFGFVFQFPAREVDLSNTNHRKE